jgi:hypothetical protein
MEHDYREATHNHPNYQTQTAHTPLQTILVSRPNLFPCAGAKHCFLSKQAQAFFDFSTVHVET